MEGLKLKRFQTARGSSVSSVGRLLFTLRFALRPRFYLERMGNAMDRKDQGRNYGLNALGTWDCTILWDSWGLGSFLKFDNLTT